IFQYFAPQLHFLIQVAVTFQLVLLIMILFTFFAPLQQPRPLPVRQDIVLKTALDVKIWGSLVIAAVAVFYVVFR
ncbi:MAG TPA: hypothetical protein PLE88_12990, partial [Anaerohalosphaeraceae bacterium]|nr:hypothetical protein [Anaerohalosphaeraceae bacterium]